MSMLKLKVGPVEAVTPRDFFDRLVPLVLDTQKELAEKLGGRISFSLFGDEGGSWTVDIGAGRVASEIEPNTDAHLEMPVTDFASMIQGTLDVTAAADAGRLRASGEVGHLASLVALLDVPQPTTPSLKGSLKGQISSGELS